MDVTPPTEATRSTWPTVIGIIAVVLGALAAMEGCFGGAAMSLIGLLADALGEDNPAVASFKAVETYLPGLIALSAATLGLGVLMIVGAAMLLRRRPRALPLLMTWAVLKIVYGLPKAWLNYRINVAQLEAMKDDPNLSMFPGTRLFELMGVAGAVFSVLWTCAMPVFLIVWFARPRIRDEVRSW